MSLEPAFVKIAIALADISRAVIAPYYRTNLALENKEDQTPVTAADKGAEQSIRSQIKRVFPEHGIIGEEEGIENPDAEYKWVIDPIDGTLSFMIGRPIFGTLISLTYKDKPILGVIDQPINRERWLGYEGDVASLNDLPAFTRECESLDKAVICTSGPQYFQPEELEKFKDIAHQAGHMVYGGDCYNYGLMASGFVDIIIEAGLKAYDFCAVAAVVDAAGGVITDWQGNPLTLQSDGKVLAAGDKRMHEKALEMINK